MFIDLPECARIVEQDLMTWEAYAYLTQNSSLPWMFSGSISTESLKYFYGVINSAFRYGFESIDVIQFDCGVRTVDNLKKVIKDVAVIGRGGTSFQEPIDYAHEKGYDGLVILTDGYAPEPDIPEGFKTGILWVCENESCLSHHKEWMEKSGRTCVMQIVS